MSYAEHEDPRPPRPSRRRQAVVGAVGLAAVLGGGAFLVTSQLSDDSATEPAGALAPAATVPATPLPGGTASPEPSASTAASSAAASASAPAAAATPSPSRTKSRQQMIDEAKGTAAKADNVRRPVPAAAGKPVTDVKVSESGSMADGGTLKVVSALGDLTGQRELSIVGDEGRAVGDARCTQKVRFAAHEPAEEKPSMLICWRTSAEKSVFTIAVSTSGRPSADRSVAAIEKQWSRIG